MVLKQWVWLLCFLWYQTPPMVPMVSNTSYGSNGFKHLLWFLLFQTPPMVPMVSNTSYGSYGFKHLLWFLLFQTPPMVPMVSNTSYGSYGFKHLLWFLMVSTSYTSYGSYGFKHLLWFLWFQTPPMVSRGCWIFGRRFSGLILENVFTISQTSSLANYLEYLAWFVVRNHGQQVHWIWIVQFIPWDTGWPYCFPAPSYKFLGWSSKDVTEKLGFSQVILWGSRTVGAPAQGGVPPKT